MKKHQCSCNLHRDICTMLDFLASKLRLKCSEPKDDDYEVGEIAWKDS
jgi:hypothetical protein